MNSFNSIEAVLYTMMNKEQPPIRVYKKHSNNGKGWNEVWKNTVDKLKEEEYGDKSEHSKQNNDKSCD